MLDVCGNRVVSGSYDNTCRVSTPNSLGGIYMLIIFIILCFLSSSFGILILGECIFVLEGHFHQIYCVAFDGVRIASGGLDLRFVFGIAETGFMDICIFLFLYKISIPPQKKNQKNQ